MRSLIDADGQLDFMSVLDKMLDSFDEVLFVDEKNNKTIEMKSDERFPYLKSSENGNKIMSEFRHMVYPDDIKKIDEFNIFSGKKHCIEIRCKDSNGEYGWCYLELIPINDASYLALFFDLKSCENEGMKMKSEAMNKNLASKYYCQLSEQKYNSVLNHAEIMVFEYDVKTGNVSITSNLQNEFLFTNNFSGKIDEFLSENYIHKNDISLLNTMIERVKDNVHCADRIRFRDNNGEYFWSVVYISGIYDASGELVSVIGTAKDIDVDTENIKQKNSFVKTDGLSGLLSSKQFCFEMKNIMSAESDKKFAVILFDIEKFQSINELYGVEFADEVIRFIAHNLKNGFAGKYQLTSRFVSDYFGIFTDYENDSDILKMIESFNNSISFFKHVSLKIAYGIYKITDNAASPRRVCDYANMAKNSIKKSHGQNYAFYCESMTRKILEDRSIENEMENALATRQFAMYLQPKYDIQSGGIIGAEALVRWNHPQKGIIMPNNFVPLFERNGFILKLDAYIWEEACKTIRKWIDLGEKPVPISVNVSRVNAGNPNLIGVLNGLIEKYNIDKKYLELEITETIYYDDQKLLINTLESLKEFGYTLLMDDFGAGFSSLNMLQNTPFDTLKIDKNFLNDTLITDKGKKIIFHTISLSNDIGMDTVAEGVETREQAEYLLKCGCNVAQGYYYSKPVTVNTFEDMLMVK